MVGTPFFKDNPFLLELLENVVRDPWNLKYVARPDASNGVSARAIPWSLLTKARDAAVGDLDMAGKRVSKELVNMVAGVMDAAAASSAFPFDDYELDLHAGARAWPRYIFSLLSTYPTHPSTHPPTHPPTHQGKRLHRPSLRALHSQVHHRPQEQGGGLGPLPLLGADG